MKSLVLLVLAAFPVSSSFSKDIFIEGEKDRFFRTTLNAVYGVPNMKYEICQIEDFEEGTGYCKGFLQIPLTEYERMRSCLHRHNAVSAVGEYGGLILGVVAVVFSETLVGGLVIGYAGIELTKAAWKTQSKNSTTETLVVDNDFEFDQDVSIEMNFDSYVKLIKESASENLLGCAIKGETWLDHAIEPVKFTEHQVKVVRKLRLF